MGTHDHEHTWERVANIGGSHFVDQPNSKWRSKPVVKVRCATCDQRGFRYHGSRVVLTWDKDQSNWLEEL